MNPDHRPLFSYLFSNCTKKKKVRKQICPSYYQSPLNCEPQIRIQIVSLNWPLKLSQRQVLVHYPSFSLTVPIGRFSRYFFSFPLFSYSFCAYLPAAGCRNWSRGGWLAARELFRRGQKGNFAADWNGSWPVRDAHL